jgi:ATP-binding cassette subfamily F protein 3
LVEQEIPGTATSVLQTVLETDYEREELLNEEKELTNDADANGARINEIMSRLEELDAFEAGAKASIILRGLGFSNEDLQRPTADFSGGWRMRVALARALFADPDILLLDEPTNHLDLEAVMWLEDYLTEWPNTCIIVSHAREFLNVVCTDIYHVHDQKLNYYKGNYDEYDRKRCEVIMQRRKALVNQEEKIEHVTAFINKFRASKARGAMVQSRIKQLNKMEMVEEILEDPTIVFRFPNPEELAPPLLKIEEGSFGYDPSKILLKGIEFGVTMDSRIALVGANGCGKTTLLNLLLGDLQLTQGRQERNPKLRISMFTQHFMDQLDLKLSPLEQLMKDFPGHKEEHIRGYLAGFGITGNMSLRPHYLLSGGQKSRVAFAVAVWKHPQIMILDEPTNHLDIDAINALILALNTYEGGILIVSHDQHLIESVCDEIWYVKDKKVTKFKGDFQEYRKFIASEREI